MHRSARDDAGPTSLPSPGPAWGRPFATRADSSASPSTAPVWWWPPLPSVPTHLTRRATADCRSIIARPRRWMPSSLPGASRHPSSFETCCLCASAASRRRQFTPAQTLIHVGSGRPGLRTRPDACWLSRVVQAYRFTGWHEYGWLGNRRRDRRRCRIFVGGPSARCNGAQIGIGVGGYLDPLNRAAPRRPAPPTSAQTSTYGAAIPAFTALSPQRQRVLWKTTPSRRWRRQNKVGW